MYWNNFALQWIPSEWQRTGLLGDQRIDWKEKNRKTLRLGSSNQGLPQRQNGMQATALLNGIVVLAADTEEKNLAMAGMEKGEESTNCKDRDLLRYGSIRCF